MLVFYGRSPEFIFMYFLNRSLIPREGNGYSREAGPAFSVGFTPATLRICARPAPAIPRKSLHFPSKIFGNLSKNPVNLSIFTVFYGNSEREAMETGEGVFASGERGFVVTAWRAAAVCWAGGGSSRR